MSTVSFSRPVTLPVFVDEVQQPDILCAGAIYHSYPYDGRRNLVEITPIAHVPGLIGAIPANAVGQSYTIGERDLTMRIVGASWGERVTCAACGRHSYGARPSETCCLVEMETSGPQ